MREIADGRSDDCAGKSSHVEIKPNGKATYEHEPGSVFCGLVARGGNHVAEKLSIRIGGDEPGVGFGEEKGDGRGVRGKRDGRFVCTGCCRAKNG